MRVAAKKDSIGVCFCPLDYRSFLKREVPVEQLPGKGHFIDEKGNVLGSHEGYPFYTIGQRRGLGIHLNRAVFVKEVRNAKPTRWYLHHCLLPLYKNEMHLKDWNLISEHRVLGAETVIVKIRYRKQANRCMVAQEENGHLRVSLLEPLEAIARGRPPPFMMRTACCWAVVSFFEVELQHLFNVLSCIAEARYLMLSAKFAFTVQPIVEQILCGQRLSPEAAKPGHSAVWLHSRNSLL